jgi:hypothetical protein
MVVIKRLAGFPAILLIRYPVHFYTKILNSNAKANFYFFKNNKIMSTAQNQFLTWVRLQQIKRSIGKF